MAHRDNKVCVLSSIKRVNNREPSRKFSRHIQSSPWRTPWSSWKGMRQRLARCQERSRWARYSEIIPGDLVEGKQTKLFDRSLFWCFRCLIKSYCDEGFITQTSRHVFPHLHKWEMFWRRFEDENWDTIVWTEVKYIPVDFIWVLFETNFETKCDRRWLNINEYVFLPHKIYLICFRFSVHAINGCNDAQLFTL